MGLLEWVKGKFRIWEIDLGCVMKFLEGWIFWDIRIFGTGFGDITKGFTGIEEFGKLKD